MRTTGVAFALAASGAAVTAFGLLYALHLLNAPPHVRPNYRGRDVLGTAGLVLTLPLLVGTAARFLWPPPEGTRTALVILAIGMALAAFGFTDDVFAKRRAGGFLGHARELAHGRVTTGMVKAVGGGVSGLVGAWSLGWQSVWILVAGGVIALAANFANLLDLRPGRVIKVWYPCAFVLLAIGVPGGGNSVMFAVAGGLAVFAFFELRERVMLGDTGANLLGGVLGVAAAGSVGRAGILGLLAALGALTLASEAVSFSRVIEAVPALRWVDGLGRRD